MHKITDALDVLLSPADVASRYGYRVSSLANARHLGTGPRFVKLGNGAIRYRLRDVLEWELGSARPARGSRQEASNARAA